jgi:DNA-binding response OmpR family regulator
VKKLSATVAYLNSSPTPQRILVIDHNPDSGELFVRSLRRKFPNATLLQTVEAAESVKTAESIALDAIVLHRAYDADAETLVKLLRAANNIAPIIVLSGADRSEKVLAAGATGFLNADQWLMLGTVVANAIAAQKK